MIASPAFAAGISPECASQLSGIQKAAGFFTFINTMWVLGIGIGVLSLSVLVFHWCRWLLLIFVLIPLSLYEVLFYLVSGGLVWWGRGLSPEVAPFVGLTGCLLLLGALIFTFTMRGIIPTGWVVCGLLAVAWGATAIWYGSALIGFLAVGALMGALGFTMMMFGLGYAIGFKNEDELGRATSTSFVMLGLFVAGRIIGATDPVYKIFEPGALFLGSFVGYLGLLIASSRWYEKRYNYGVFQVVTVAAGVAALFAGSVWQIGELQKIGGTFFVLYILEKIFEIPVRSRINYAYLGVVTAGLLYGFSMYVKANPDIVRPYLLLF